MSLEDKVISALFSDDNFASLGNKLQAYRMKLATKKVGEIPQVKMKLAGVQQKIDRVVRKLAEDTITDEEARRMLADLRRDRDHYQIELEALTAGPLADLKITPATARLMREKVMDIIREAGPRRKRKFFRKFIGKTELDSSEARIFHHLINLTAHMAAGSFQVDGVASLRGTGDEPGWEWLTWKISGG